MQKNSKGHKKPTPSPKVSAEKIIATAKSYRGVRYSYGSASRGGTDCSGFILQVYRAAGVKLPHSSSEQAGYGKPVSRGNLKPGDLLFFHTVRGTRISHVAIYLGKNQFIHASSGGGRVQVNSLNQDYYHNRFVCARRLANFSSGQLKAIEETAKHPDAAFVIPVAPSANDSEAIVP